MNAQGRKQVQALLEKLENLRSEMEAVGSEIQSLSEEERDKYDNLPEGLQQCEAGEKLDEIASQLEEAVDACESGDLGAAIEALELIG